MNHPYVDLEKTPLWNTVNAVITDLEKNQDLKLTTTRQYVVGYICKHLVEKNLITPEATTKTDFQR